MLAAWLASTASTRASDDADFRQPAAVQSSELPDDSDSAFNATQPASATPDSPHATRLKWKPYHGMRDRSVVQAQALAEADPNSNPFNDDKSQPSAQPLQLPAPTTNPDTTNPNGIPSRLVPVPTPSRVPARLNPGDPFDAHPAAPQKAAPNTPFLTPAPSDVEDLTCATHQRRCNEDESALIKNTIDKIGLNINVEERPTEPLPCDCNLGAGVAFEPRQWPLITFTWKASALCHKPLYFEEVQLERYGHSAGPIAEPLLSAAHFFITVPLLPYYMGVDPPQECQYTLGYYRPGDCAPYMLDPFPLSVRGALLEAGAVGIVTWVIP
jgi:hypothetical protein